MLVVCVSTPYAHTHAHTPHKRRRLGQHSTALRIVLGSAAWYAALSRRVYWHRSFSRAIAGVGRRAFPTHGGAAYAVNNGGGLLTCGILYASLRYATKRVRGDITRAGFGVCTARISLARFKTFVNAIV